MSKSSREPRWSCHTCGYMMDAASAFDHSDAVPKEGDYALCLNCGACHIRHGARWSKITAAEFAEMPPENRREIALGTKAIGEADFPDLSKRSGPRAR